jgi:hypothetical protein
MHVRTPIMIGVILMLVILMSGFCYYRVSSTNLGTLAPSHPGTLDVDAALSGLISQRI